MNTLLEKFTQVLLRVSDEQQAKLFISLNKIVPQNAESLADWRANWAYDLEKDKLRIFISFRIINFVEKTNLDLPNLMLNLWNCSKPFAQESEFVLNKILEESHPTCELFTNQLVFLSENMATLSFYFLANVQNTAVDYTNLKKQVYENREVQ